MQKFRSLGNQPNMDFLLCIYVFRLKVQLYNTFKI